MIGVALGMLYILLKDFVESLTHTNESEKSRPHTLMDWTPPGSGYAVSATYLKRGQSCPKEHGNYCLNGICTFHTELKMPTCRCLAGYSGERCEHLMLNSYTQYSSESYSAFGIGAGMLLIGMCAVIFCYLGKRYKETKSSYRVCHEETAV